MSAKTPPKPGKDVIYVDVDDDITAIIDKVDSTTQKVVALVLPKRAASLQSIVNMKLLKRSAEDASKNVVLITSEHALMPLAGAAGLHVAKNLQSKPVIPEAPAGINQANTKAAEDVSEDDMADNEESKVDELPGKFDYAKPIGALAAAHEAKNPDTIDLDDEDNPKPAPAPKKPSSKVSVPNFDRFRMLLGLGVLALVSLIVFIILAIFVLPKAKITITTSSEPVSATFNLTASEKTTELDIQKGAIPAKLHSSEQTGSQQVQATGQQNNGERAKGSVSMSAQKCSGNPFIPPDPVPAGTGVSSGGVTFITQESTSFQGTGTSGSCYTYSGSDAADVTAQSPGSKYNLSEANFTVSGRSDVSASGSTSGGSDNIVTILSQADIDGAKQKLTSGTTSDDFVKAFKKKLEDEGEYVLASTLKTGEANVTASPSVGQPASTANVAIKITYTVLSVKKDDLSKAIEEKTANQIDKTKQKLSGDFLADATVTVQSQPTLNSAVLNIEENTTAVPIISISAVKKIAAGKKTGDIKSAINNWPGVKSVDVKLSPFWVNKVPKKDKKITVVLKEVKDNQEKSAP